MNRLLERWMSKDLYEQCEICRGEGVIDSEQLSTMMIDPPSALQKLKRPGGGYTCPGCVGVKFIKIGLTVGQVERMRAELDRLKAGAPAR
jgi:hypothetical protein